LTVEIRLDFREAPIGICIDLVVPEPQDLPALQLQGLVDQDISLYVGSEFLDPKLAVVLGGLAVQVISAVPEGTIAKDRQFLFLETDVGSAKNRPVILTVSIAKVPQSLSQNNLDLGVLAVDSGHNVRSLLFAYPVYHNLRI